MTQDALYEHDTVPSVLDGLSRRVPDGDALPVLTDLDELWCRVQARPGLHAARLGDALIQAGLLTPTQLQHALQRQSNSDVRLPVGEQLVKDGVLTAAQLRQMLAA